MPRYLSPEEVAQLLGLPVGSVLRLARQRRIPHCIVPGGEVRFEPADVEAMVERVPAESACALRLAPGTCSPC
jgi:excisionase family DNA binding protein